MNSLGCLPKRLRQLQVLIGNPDVNTCGKRLLPLGQPRTENRVLGINAPDEVGMPGNSGDTAQEGQGGQETHDSHNHSE